MSALCPHCEKPVTYVKCYSIDIESSGAIQSGTAFACPSCSVAISVSLGAPPVVAGLIQETVEERQP
jgi:hypothetical protein